MSVATEDRLERENAYLKTRNAQLQDDVNSLSSELDRLRGRIEGVLDRRRGAAPNPLSGGQS